MAWVLGLSVTQAALLVGTFFWDHLGTQIWHHVASLGLVAGLAIVLRRQMVVRRFLAIGVLAFTILAAVSGFYLLYWKEGIRIDGYQDWGVFWHVLWSWAAMVFFFQHTWVNRVALGHFFRRSFRTLGPAMVHVGAYLALVAAFFLTWSPAGRTLFTGANYIQLSLWAWLMVVGPLYGGWLAVAYLLRRGRAQAFGHWPVRRAVDLVLVPAAALTVLSGIPLLFFDDPLDAAGFKYVSKYWHVWPSVVFAAFVAVHAIQAWRSVRAHWRTYGRP